MFIEIVANKLKYETKYSLLDGLLQFLGIKTHIPTELRSCVRKQSSGPEPTYYKFWVDHQQFTRIDFKRFSFYT